MNAVASRNVKFVSHSDQGGRGDGVQIMVHRGYAYIGHGYTNGITVLDVRDPKEPEARRLPALRACSGSLRPRSIPLTGGPAGQRSSDLTGK